MSSGSSGNASVSMSAPSKFDRHGSSTTSAALNGTHRPNVVQPIVRARWLEKIAVIGRLEKGWNGYSAPAPTVLALQNANDFFEVACDRDIVPERLDASAMGGVGITFAEGSREVVAEFYNNGTAHGLFADNMSKEMNTRRIPPIVEGYAAFLEEVRQYLHGRPRA